MAWEVFSIIGTIAFAISGAIIAMEEEYDLFGVYILGIVTAFGGGAIRNLLIGLPVTTLWGQDMMFQIALAAITIFFYFSTSSNSALASLGKLYGCHWLIGICYSRCPLCCKARHAY